jgi:hypothetical protein
MVQLSTGTIAVQAAAINSMSGGDAQKIALVCDPHFHDVGDFGDYRDAIRERVEGFVRRRKIF